MKRHSNVTINWTCPRCERETSVTVSPIIPAKVSGPPEDCYPEEGGEIDPDQCEHCGHRIRADKAYKFADEQEQAAYEAWAEDEADRRREDRATGRTNDEFL